MTRSAHRAIRIPLGLLCGALALARPGPAGALDVPVKQVHIEARVMEASDSFSQELGLDWRATTGEPRAHVDTTSDVLRALESGGGARLLAQPRVSTVSGQAATIEVGGEIPVTAAADPASATFEDFGIRLSIVPSITPRGQLAVTIDSAVSDVDTSGAVPEITQRSARTAVQLDPGQTVVIGGLFPDDARTLPHKVPSLADVPVLGRLFQSEGFVKGDTNMFVTLTLAITEGGEPPSVQFETRFVELDRGALADIGIDFSGQPGGLRTSTADIDAVLRSLAQRGDSTLLAEPRAVTLSGQRATITAGGEVPVPRGSGPSGASFENYGIQLDLVPHVAADTNLIRLEILPTVSDVDTSGSVPRITRRTLATDVLLDPGQTVAIGGLFEEDTRAARSQIPGLANLPILGSLFRRQARQTRDTELVVFVTPVLYDEDGRAIETAGGHAPAPRSQQHASAGPSGGYFRQGLPAHSGDLGVQEVGGRERPLISLPTAIGTGGGGADILVHLPQIGGNGASLRLDGFYADDRRNGSNRIMAQPAVVNGITYWERAQNGSTGISSTGAGLEGAGDLDLTVFQVRTGLRLDVTSVVDATLTRLDGAIRGTNGQAAEPLPGAPPTAPQPATYLEALGSVGYIHQKASQWAMLGNEDPGFALFDVRTDNRLDLTEWSALASLGLLHSHPLGAIPGLALVIGGEAGIGYRHSSGDGRQRNMCDVRFTNAPGVNACAPEIQDFTVRKAFDASGFDWSIGASAGLAYELSCVLDGLVANLGYDFSYVGVSRFRTPTNLDEDGPARIQRTHQPRHQLGMSINYSF